MARKALSPFDRGMTVLSVTTFVVPPWVYGILFILVFGFGLKVFPSGGLTSVPPPPPAPLSAAFPPLIAIGLALAGYLANKHVRTKYRLIRYGVMAAAAAVLVAWILAPYDHHQDLEWHLILPAPPLPYSVRGPWAHPARTLDLQ